MYYCDFVGVVSVLNLLSAASRREFCIGEHHSGPVSAVPEVRGVPISEVIKAMLESTGGIASGRCMCGGCPLLGMSAFRGLTGGSCHWNFGPGKIGPGPIFPTEILVRGTKISGKIGPTLKILVPQNNFMLCLETSLMNNDYTSM